MKLVTSLLLAAPATIAAVAAAQAADLPSREAAPIQYVRVCDAYGSGFFFIPGTDTCLYVGGYVRVEAQYTPGQAVISPTTANVTQASGDQDTTGMEVRGRVDLDARTQTQWGTVQTVIWLRGASTDGIKALSGSAAGTTAIAAGGYAPTTAATGFTMERAYVRFAGITAGVSTENFLTMPGYMYSGLFASYPSGVKQLAYTATFGGGFSSTIALESRGDLSNDVGMGQYSYVNQFDTGYDLVGNLRYEGGWGYAQLAGALGDNSYQNGLSAIPDSVTLANSPTNNPLLGATTKAAYALGASAKINLPRLHVGPAGIGPGGDALFLNVAYGHGMDGLTGCNQSTSACPDQNNRRFDGGVIRFDNNLVPTSAAFTGGGAVVPGSITFGIEDTWTVGAMLTHYWSPNWRSNIAFQYERFDEPMAAASVGLQLGDADEYSTGANLIWSPVADFDIGVEIDYARLNQSLQNPTAAFAVAGSPGLDEDNWSSKLRLERLF